jgi:hypothetical protein
MRLVQHGIKWVLTIANAAGTNDGTNVPSEAPKELEIINFGHPSEDRPLQTGNITHISAQSNKSYMFMYIIKVCFVWDSNA